MLKQMSDQELGTLVYWEISRAIRNRPRASRVTVISALELIRDRLTHLNPERAIVKRLQELKYRVIDGDGTDDALFFDEAMEAPTTIG